VHVAGIVLREDAFEELRFRFRDVEYPPLVSSRKQATRAQLADLRANQQVRSRAHARTASTKPSA
jgi:hypothetical protein